MKCNTTEAAAVEEKEEEEEEEEDEEEEEEEEEKVLSLIFFLFGICLSGVSSGFYSVRTRSNDTKQDLKKVRTKIKEKKNGRHNNNNNNNDNNKKERPPPGPSQRQLCEDKKTAVFLFYEPAPKTKKTINK